MNCEVMTIKELIAQRRAMLARMTPGPWIEKCGINTIGGRFVADGPSGVDLDGIATLRNDAERLWALVEALVAEREAYSWGIYNTNAIAATDAALAAMLEGK